MEKIWIWGCGFLGRIALKALETDDKRDIRGLIDNDEKKQNLVLHGHSVRSFEEQKEGIAKEDIILCCCTLDNYKRFKAYLERRGYQRYLHFWDLDMKKLLFRQVENGYEGNLVSKCCTQEDFYSPSFRRIAEEMHLPSKLHRKYWEFVYIAQVLETHHLLEKGRSGIGFAVGLEPLPSFFAGRGVDILATDLPITADGAGEWAATGQNAGGDVDRLWRESICDKSMFQKHVRYRDVDMNKIPENIGVYDFCWSSCAVEHVGSLRKSKEFLKNMLAVLKPGGIGVHTTEFNLISNDDTVEEGNSVIFRRKDIEEMRDWFTAQGHRMEVSFTRGCREGDLFVDIPPFRAEPYHLNLQLDEYIATSFAIVVQKRSSMGGQPE